MVEEKTQNNDASNENCGSDSNSSSNSSEDSCKNRQEDAKEAKSEKDSAAAASSVNTEIILRRKVKDLEDQIATLKEAVIRKIAETENLRKRFEREKSDAMKYANGKFAKDLLGVADNFDRVMQHIESLGSKAKDDATLKPIAQGVELCGKELLSVFRKHGIDRVNVSEGTNFDPNYHQAMCEVESDKHNPGAVINVMQSGYVYNDRLLRPAMVSVAKKPADKA